MREPVLQYPDFTKPFVLTTDASGFAVGAILNQGKIDQDKPIAFVSRNLNQGEQNYSKLKKLNSVALVRERTIPTERPPPVGEVSANFSG